MRTLSRHKIWSVLVDFRSVFCQLFHLILGISDRHGFGSGQVVWGRWAAFVLSFGALSGGGGGGGGGQ